MPAEGGPDPVRPDSGPPDEGLPEAGPRAAADGSGPPEDVPQASSGGSGPSEAGGPSAAPAGARRCLWRGRWGYPESLAVVGSVLAGGLAAQWLAGPPPPLPWPGSLLLALGLIVLSLICRLARRARPVAFLVSAPLSVALILALGLLGLIMGLTPQAAVHPPGPVGPVARLGLDRLTASWALAAVYLLTLACLGAVVAVRFSVRRPVFVVLHLGLWLLLVAAGVGAADRSREVMLVPEGGLEWRVRRPGGQVVELPLAIRLDDFELEEYPARVAIFDHSTGEPAAAGGGRPELFQLDPMEPEGRLGGYDLELLEFLPSAAPMGESSFVRAIALGSVQAARIRATDRSTGEAREGWISSGGGARPPQALPLEGEAILAMVRPEPRRFVSKVKAYTQEGQEAEGAVEVNKPLAIGPWLVYQRDYDSAAGRASSWSGFELVRDPWLPLAWAGLAMMGLGSACLVLRPGGAASRAGSAGRAS